MSCINDNFNEIHIFQFQKTLRPSIMRDCLNELVI